MYPIPAKNSLRFVWTDVAKAVDEVRNASHVRPLYGNDTGPGLWLVGDHGIYLMPNTTHKARTIVYAVQCDPTKLDFDEWWETKRATFGGGDGIEFIALTEIDRVVAVARSVTRSLHYLFINMSPEHFAIGII